MFKQLFETNMYEILNKLVTYIILCNVRLELDCVDYVSAFCGDQDCENCFFEFDNVRFLTQIKKIQKKITVKNCKSVKNVFLLCDG